MADLVNNNALTEASQQLQAQLLLQQQQQPLSWYSSFLSFTQGFLLGQASVVLLVFVFLKYFIFGDAKTVRRGKRREKDEGQTRGQKQRSSKRQSKWDRKDGRSVSVDSAGSYGSGSSSTSTSRSSSDEQDQSSLLATDAAAATAVSVLRPNRPLSTGALLDKTYYHARRNSLNSRREIDHHSEYVEDHPKHHHHHHHPQGHRKYDQHHNQHQKSFNDHRDPESLDWFNVLVAQTIAQLRADACSDNVLLERSLTEALNGDAKPGWMDEIRVTQMSLGEEFPIFRNCRIVYGRPVGSEGHGRTLGGEKEGLRKQKGGRRKKARKILQAHMDVELKDAITLGLETKLVLNYPRPLAAMLPVGLVVEVVRFEGTLSISFDNSSAEEEDDDYNTPLSSSAPRANPTASTSNGQSTSNHNNRNQHKINQHNSQTATTNATPETSTHSKVHSSSTPALSSPSSLHLNLTLLPDYTLDLAIRSQLGSRSRIQDIPKIAQLVEQRLLAWFEQQCVAPRGGWTVGLPRLLDSMRDGQRQEAE